MHGKSEGDKNMICKHKGEIDNKNNLVVCNICKVVKYDLSNSKQQGALNDDVLYSASRQL